MLPWMLKLGSFLELLREAGIDAVIDVRDVPCATSPDSLCFERDPQDCHRGILSRAWAKSRAAVVRHLGAEREP